MYITMYGLDKFYNRNLIFFLKKTYKTIVFNFKLLNIYKIITLYLNTTFFIPEDQYKINNIL